MFKKSNMFFSKIILSYISCIILVFYPTLTVHAYSNEIITKKITPDMNT